jgi:uncharacterized protein YgiM (DUF1202 family)
MTHTAGRRRIGRIALAFLALIVGACQQADDTPPPTLMVLPTLEPTATQTATPTLTPTPSASPTPTLSPTPTSTATATNTPTPTDTITPTPTVTATNTLTATITDTATPSPTPVQIVITSAVGAYARGGPGIEYEPVGVVDADTRFDALAFAVDFRGDVWYLIALDDGVMGWVSEYVAERADGAPLAQIAMAVTIPVTPTLLPTLTPSLTPTITATPTLPPGANARIHDESEVNLRGGPGLAFNRLGMMLPGAPLRLIGRNADRTWFQTQTFDGRVGWVFAELVRLYGIEAGSLPVTWTEPVVVAPPGGGSALPLGARAIFQRGQQVGNRANSFIVIGDSTSARSSEWMPLFNAFRVGSYNLGGYGYLQSTVDFFRGSDSFGADFQTARPGFSTAFVIEPTWADPAVCAPGETPLTCEYRLRKPAVAILYIGIMDMLISTPEVYRQNLDAIVKALIDRGVIPVLTTLTASEQTTTAQGNIEKLRQINTIIRETARRYQIPLVELQQAAYPLPNQGCVEDGHHLSFRVDGVINFTGDEGIYGKDLRELMTLQTLHDLRVNVMGQ